MTGVYVVGTNRLVFDGDLEDEEIITSQYGLRVSFSDGTVVHFRQVGGHWKVFLLRKGDLLEVVSVLETTDRLIFKKGIRWAFGSARFFEVLSQNVSKKVLQNKLVTLAAEKGVQVG